MPALVKLGLRMKIVERTCRTGNGKVWEDVKNQTAWLDGLSF